MAFRMSRPTGCAGAIIEARELRTLDSTSFSVAGFRQSRPSSRSKHTPVVYLRKKVVVVVRTSQIKEKTFELPKHRAGEWLAPRPSRRKPILLLQQVCNHYSCRRASRQASPSAGRYGTESRRQQHQKGTRARPRSRRPLPFLRSPTPRRKSPRPQPTSAPPPRLAASRLAFTQLSLGTAAAFRASPWPEIARSAPPRWR
jgi:hypothetical protein